MSTTVYSQVLIYTAESTGTTMERTKMSNLRNGSKGGFEPGLTRLRVRHSTAELPRSIDYDLGPGFNCYPLTKFRTNITNTIPSEAVTSQHRVLVAEMRVKKSKQRKSLGRKLINEACVRDAFCRKIVAKLSELLRKHLMTWRNVAAE